MNGKNFNSIAAALLTLLDAASAEAEKTVRTAAEEAPQSPARRPLREADDLFPPARRSASAETALPEYFRAAPGQETDISAGETPVPVSAPELTAAVGETLGSEDAMEIIDEFFRRDSRRYDGGFDAERVL